tara:strand:- start:1188 stop:1409 length:222 start_codon:yes stop_codon:yes gene_type:complete
MNKPDLLIQLAPFAIAIIAAVIVIVVNERLAARTRRQARARRRDAYRRRAEEVTEGLFDPQSFSILEKSIDDL